MNWLPHRGRPERFVGYPDEYDLYDPDGNLHNIPEPEGGWQRQPERYQWRWDVWDALRSKIGRST